MEIEADLQKACVNRHKHRATRLCAAASAFVGNTAFGRTPHVKRR
jgi:hypothetical protein